MAFPGRRYISWRVNTTAAGVPIWAARNCPEPGVTAGKHLGIGVGSDANGVRTLGIDNATALVGQRHIGVKVQRDATGEDIYGVDVCEDVVATPCALAVCAAGLPKRFYVTIAVSGTCASDFILPNLAGVSFPIDYDAVLDLWRTDQPTCGYGTPTANPTGAPTYLWPFDGVTYSLNARVQCVGSALRVVLERFAGGVLDRSFSNVAPSGLGANHSTFNVTADCATYTFAGNGITMYQSSSATCAGANLNLASCTGVAVTLTP